jgi:hypothetical protein
MRVLVCGGRDYDEEDTLFAALDSLKGVSHIIEGGAPGADALAREWAKSRAVPHTSYPADWLKYGRAAGPVRNRQMLREGKPNLVVAFPTGGPGTKNMIGLAEKAGVPVIIH